jgi:NitT/TauT family transport system substrate-binding protein
LPVAAIGAVFQRIDVAFIAKGDAGVATLSDFRGRTVSTWHTGVHLILRALLRRAGVDPASIVEVPQTESMLPFLQGEVSVEAATFFNQLPQLPQLRGQGLTDLVVFDPADHGVVFPRDVIIASERMVVDRPDVVRRFLRAGLRGWKQAIAHQGEAVAAVMRRDPTLDRDHQAVMMREVSKLMLYGPGTTRGIGCIEPAAIEAAHRFLLENGQIGKPVDLSRAYTTQFWQAI